MNKEQKLAQLRIDWKNAKTKQDRDLIERRAKLLLKAMKKEEV